MTNKNFLIKYQLILFLSFIVVAMGMIKMIWGYKGDLPEKQESQTTPTISLPIPTTETGLSEEDYPLWKFLPYKGKSFTAEQYKTPLLLTVSTTEEKQLEAKKELNTWLENLNIDTEEHEIEWVFLP